MSRRLLIEGYNLTLPKGTGIKTYARNLAKIARDAGYTVDGLLHSNVRLNRKDPILAEISFFDGTARNNWKDKWIHSPLEIALGHPLGLQTIRLDRGKYVVDRGENSILSWFDTAYAAYRFDLAARRHFWRYGSFMKVKVDHQPDIFHTSQITPIAVKGAANVQTVHDVIPLRLPTATLDNKKFFLRSLRVACRTADKIVTVSECSKRDLMSLIDIPEEKIAVTYQAVSLPEWMLARSDDQTAAILENNYRLEPRGYFLYFGAIEPKKNVPALIDAYAASGTTAPLILAGGLGWSFDDAVSQINQEHFSSWRISNEEINRVRRVRHLDHVPLSHLVALIKGARAVLFPSLYEGFGLPVLEAMMLGTPVMTSNTSSLPEVAGDAALMVDPYDVDAMTRAIQTLDADADLRADLSARGTEQAKRFSMENYAAKLKAVYDTL